MRLNRVLVLHREQRTNNTECCVHLSGIQNLQRFQNGPVHEFYGLKASQMSKVRASSHEYPHVEKPRIFGNRISKVRWPTTVTTKELPSRQKQKPHGKKKNLTAKRITSLQKE